jgi:UDP-N-acetylmuramate--alanine ligase
VSIFNSDFRLEKILSLLKDVEGSVHFIGILGSGMYPLARLLHRRGYKISGSDDAVGADLDKDGIRITQPRNTLGIDVVMVIYSLAIDEENPEILCAKARGIPLVSRAQLLGAIMSLFDIRVSVSGSHGKSTVTALIDHILLSSGIAHTTVLGAKLSSGDSFVDGGGEVFLAEACEYKDSFLRLCPTHQIITSVELDHTDYFKDIESIRASFLQAAMNSRYALINCDDEGASIIAEQLKGEKADTSLTYGRKTGADYRIGAPSIKGDITSFTVFSKEREFSLKTSLIGDFNLYNITVAVAAADMLGVDKGDIERAVESFRAIERRMTLISKIGRTSVYYDYAHHPSEIRATVSALKERYGRVTLIFRPHTYSRTASLWWDFVTELGKADFTVLLDI